jgi:hypothetical protein
MVKNQEYISHPKIEFTIPQILKVSLILFFVSITLNVIDFSYQNPVEGQTTMYKCTPDMGINVSMVNCLTNTTSDTYNHSIVSEMRQNITK